MKLAWKWGFVAHTALVLVLATGYLALLAWSQWVIPGLVHAYVRLGISLEGRVGGLAVPTVDFSTLLFRTWWLWPLLPAIGWMVFEWRCRSESKGTIRLAAGALACMAMTAIVCAFATVTMTLWWEAMRHALPVSGP
jgi:hypothetical protein